METHRLTPRIVKIFGELQSIGLAAAAQSDTTSQKMLKVYWMGMSQAVAAGGNQPKKPSELLSVLDSLCMYRIEDWWTYELCYKKHVRQFHKDEKVWPCAGPCCRFMPHARLLTAYRVDEKEHLGLA